MPNHVHVVAKVFPGHNLAPIMHSWKSFTAKQINEILHRSGVLWQREYYDHLIRDEDEFERTMRYVVDNPRKAGLGNWPWAWTRTKVWI